MSDNPGSEPMGSHRHIPNVDASDIELAADTLNAVCQSIKSKIRARRGIFAADSRAMREIREGQTATKTRYAQSAFELSQTRLISAIDHAEATTELVRDLGHPIAIWTTARAALEQCATIWWLLSPDIDYRRRAARVMRIRSADADNMEKFAEQTEREFPHMSSQVNRTRSEINKERKKMADLAKIMCIEQEANENMPGPTQLIEDFIEPGTFNYRLLSTISHGRESAILELSLLGQASRLWLFDQYVDLYHAWSLINSCINWIAKSVWVYFRLTGWNYEDINQLITHYYDDVGVSAESRFVIPEQLR